MELTTHQIYALFGMATVLTLLCFLAYGAGLKTAADKIEAQAQASFYFQSAMGDQLNAQGVELVNLKRTLDTREREIKTLRRNIQAEGEDHAQVERGLLQRLAAAAPLSDEDQATLEAIASKLELAAETWQAFPTGSDHARYARQLAQLAHNMAQRLQAAGTNTQQHPDSELIDWLEAGSEQWLDEEGSYLAIPYDDSANPNGNLRQALRELMKREAFDVETACRFFQKHQPEAVA